MSIPIQEQLSVIDSDDEIEKVLHEQFIEWKGVRAYLNQGERAVWFLLRQERGNIAYFKDLEACMYMVYKTRSKKESQRLIVRVVICRIRKKLKANIVSVMKLGYVLDPKI